MCEITKQQKIPVKKNDYNITLSLGRWLKGSLCFHLCWSFLNMSVKCYNLSFLRREQSTLQLFCHLATAFKALMCSHVINKTWVPLKAAWTTLLSLMCSTCHADHWVNVGVGAAVSGLELKWIQLGLNVVLFHFSATSFRSDCRKIDFKTKAIKQLAMESVK